MAPAKNKPRGRINLNFDLTDDAQLAIYHLLRAKGAERCATQWIMSHLAFDLDGGGDIPATVKTQEKDGERKLAQAENKKSLERDVPTPAPHTGKDTVQAWGSSFSQHTDSGSVADLDTEIAENVADIISVFGS